MLFVECLRMFSPHLFRGLDQAIFCSVVNCQRWNECQKFFKKKLNFNQKTINDLHHLNLMWAELCMNKEVLWKNCLNFCRYTNNFKERKAKVNINSNRKIKLRWPRSLERNFKKLPNVKLRIHTNPELKITQTQNPYTEKWKNADKHSSQTQQRQQFYCNSNRKRENREIDNICTRLWVSLTPYGF